MNSEELLKEQFKNIIGQKETKNQLKSTLLSGHHIIIIGPPGIGKTTLAKSLSNLLPEIEVSDCPYHCLPDKPFCPKCREKIEKTKKVSGKERFVRIQGSPDLTSEDLLGDIDPIKAMKYGPLSIEAFTPGKIFKANNGILFFDEVNRCPEKLQNALLQVLEEGRATLGSYDIELPANFVFIGTMNPEDSSTEKLSEVFLDRFDIIYMNHPKTKEEETEIVTKYGKNLEILFPKNLLEDMIEMIRDIRSSNKLEKVPSVRATLSLYERAQANALIKENKRVAIEDIKEAMVSVLSHRIALKPSVKYLQDPVTFIKEELQRFSSSETSEGNSEEGP